VSAGRMVHSVCCVVRVIGVRVVGVHAGGRRRGPTRGSARMWVEGTAC
jgi:hypothetical protein